MNELSNTTKTLPQTIEEKTAFVLFGSDALNAYRKKLKAIQSKYGISSEQYKQIQLEAQETAENLLLFSADIGKEMQKIEKASGNQFVLSDDNGKKHKSDTIHEMGFTDRQARDFQTLAKHPETVQKAIEDARKEDRIVTRQDVLNRIVVPAPRKNPVKEVVENAKKEHEAFRDAKVVNIKDIEKDKLNVEITTNETYLKISKGAKAASDLCLLNIKDVEELARTLSREEKDRLINSLMLANKTLMKIMADLEY